MPPMTFEKIAPQLAPRCDVCFGPTPCSQHMVTPAPAPTIEHPAARAARMIKELHEENIALIDSGHVFLRNGVDVGEQIKVASLEQITLCNHVIERAATMDPKFFDMSHMILIELQDTLAAKQAEASEDTPLPEVGNFDHE
jgi:hypothetical protein